MLLIRERIVSSKQKEMRHMYREQRHRVKIIICGYIRAYATRIILEILQIIYHTHCSINIIVDL